MDLEEGEPYEFRVSAVNSNGVSEPLLTTKAVIPRHDFGKTIISLQVYIEGV